MSQWLWEELSKNVAVYGALGGLFVSSTEELRLLEKDEYGPNRWLATGTWMGVATDLSGEESVCYFYEGEI